jgi:hypothetical protein
MTTHNPHRESDELLLQQLARRYPKLSRGAVFPWYTPDGWTKLRAAAADRDNLHDTFDEFEHASGARISDLVAAGHQVEKVVIDVDALITWCAAKRRPLDSSARHVFAAITLTERDSRAGHA